MLKNMDSSKRNFYLMVFGIVLSVLGVLVAIVAQAAPLAWFSSVIPPVVDINFYQFVQYSGDGDTQVTMDWSTDCGKDVNCCYKKGGLSYASVSCGKATSAHIMMIVAAITGALAIALMTTPLIKTTLSPSFGKLGCVLNFITAILMIVACVQFQSYANTNCDDGDHDCSASAGFVLVMCGGVLCVIASVFYGVGAYLRQKAGGGGGGLAGQDGGFKPF